VKHYIPLLDRFLSEGVISEALRSAIRGCIRAIREKEWKLLYRYSTVKSQIASVHSRNLKLEYPYWEDADVNTERINLTAYTLLDNLHHRIALKLHLPPSGSTVYVPTGEETENGQAIVAKVEFEPSGRASVRWQTNPQKQMR